MKPALFLTPLLGLAACTPAAPDPRGVDRDETVLTVTGTGRAEATPDQALFTAGLSSIAADAQAASARHAETMNKITAAPARPDIPARDIPTRHPPVNRIRREERPVGNNCVSTRRSRWCPAPYK